jgi:hypothetical protein
MSHQSRVSGDGKPELSISGKFRKVLAVRRSLLISKAMQTYGLFFTVIILLSGALLVFSQKPLDDVVVTGNVTNIVLCSHDDDVWNYRLVIKLHAKNVGTRPLIISAADALTDYYKVANTVDSLKTMQYAHIGWVTAGSPSDPKAVPDHPVKPFNVVAPNDSIDIDVDLRVIATNELKPGPAYLQVVAENWPDYSKDYIAKIRQAWSSHGFLWERSLHSETIAFVVPSKLKKIRCP